MSDHDARPAAGRPGERRAGLAAGTGPAACADCWPPASPPAAAQALLMCAGAWLIAHVLAQAIFAARPLAALWPALAGIVVMPPSVRRV